MLHEREQAVADQVHRRLVAGEEQQQHDAAQLLLGQDVARLLDREQPADEIVLRLGAPRLEQAC